MTRAIRSVLLGGFALLLVGPPARAGGVVPGELDPSFGDGGKVTTTLGWKNQFAADLAVQADGRIVVAVSSGKPYGAVVRYHVDGTVDRSFGKRGKVLITPDVGSLHLAALAIQQDGRIVVAGEHGVDARVEFAVIRLMPDGSPDASFGAGGMVFTRFDHFVDFATSVAVQPNGRIVAAGQAGPEASVFALARYLPDGSLDPSFGAGGKRTTAFPGAGNVGISGIALQTDGTIIATGTAGNFPEPTEIALAKYRANGSLDRSFGTNGRVLTDVNGEAFAGAVTVQDDGRIVVAVQASDGFLDRFGVGRYRSDGSLDTSFGDGGVVLTPFRRCRNVCQSSAALAVAVQSDGRIVAAGEALGSGGVLDTDFAIARYLPDGSLDRSFSGNGKVLTDFDRDSDEGTCMALQPDGRILVAGSVTVGHSVEVGLARYISGP